MEISERIEDNCAILVTWDPPANTDQSDINHYIVNVTSQNIPAFYVSSAIAILRVPNCRDDIRIQVTAVNRIGCMGQNFEVQASLLDIPAASTEDEPTSATEGGSASTSSK